MDDQVQRLLDLITEDSINRHIRAAKGDLSEYDRVRTKQRLDKIERRREIGLIEQEYESYSSRRWVYEASILTPHADRFLNELGEAIRAQNRSAKAGDIFQQGAAKFLNTLDVLFLRRFDNARPFYRGGKKLPVPPYWADERPALDRRIEIERLKFDISFDGDSYGSQLPVDRTVSPNGAGSSSSRLRPCQEDLNDWAIRIGNVPRDQVTSTFLAEKWTHHNPKVRPTIREAQRALDKVHGKRPRGNPGNSNRK